MNSSSLTTLVAERFPDAVSAWHAFRGDETVVLRREFLGPVAAWLKDDAALRMNLLVDVTAVDYSAFGRSPAPAFFASSGVAVKPAAAPNESGWPGPPAEAYFAVVYHFFSLEHRHRLRLVVPLDEADAEVDTVTELWPAADWLEREVWDMYGIRFRGHPDLKRILMYESFAGHPLRKDYPVNKRQPLIGPVN